MATLSALIAGIAIGAVVISASEAPGAAAGPVRSDLNVASTWSGRATGLKLISGSLRGDSGRGFVLLQGRSRQPVFFSTPEGAGALTLISASPYAGWVFRSQDGSLAVVDWIGEGPDNTPSFTFLGRPLDSAHLGSIGARGVAVPIAYGPWAGNKVRHRSETAVMLVGQTSGYPGWKLFGYLPGFSLPQGMPREHALQRPLLGPDGRLYSIDPMSERLIRGRAWRNPVESYMPKFGCTTWPAAGGASYRACANSIVRSGSGGDAVTVLHRHVQDAPYRSWSLVTPSPDGKWLLLEDKEGACGVATWAYFLRSSGGRLVEALPQAFASEALGWLPDSTALVAGQTQGCAGSPPAGIYRVSPGSSRAATQLVVAANAEDATGWGFGR